MEIKFEMVNDQKVNIKSGDTVIGHIFTPSGSGEGGLNAIQVCGFEEAFDLWGCGIFGEEVTTRINFDAEKRARLTRLRDDAPEGSWTKKHWAETLEEGHLIEDKVVMKKDIQLLYKDYKSAPRHRRAKGSCWACYNRPCTCDNKGMRPDGVSPYNTTSSWILTEKNKVEWKNRKKAKQAMIDAVELEKVGIKP